MTKDFGGFQLVGMIASICIFEIYSSCSSFFADLEGNKTISYYLTLPIPSWMIFIKQALALSCRTLLVTSLIIPFGKLLIGSRLDLSNFSVIKFVLIFLATNFFFSAFTLLMLGIFKGIETLRTLWIRIIFPLWFLGGAEFEWNMLYNLSPTFGYLGLLNPFVYAMEGIRAAVLGQEGFIPYWISLSVLTGLTILFTWIGITRLKKRLDFV